MNRKINGLLVGLFFIIAGILYIIRDFLPFSYGYLLIAIAGVEMLVSHFYTGSTFFVILGSYLTYWGLLHTIELDSLVNSALLASTIFFVPAIIFLILYIGKKERKYLTLICLFTLLGIDTMLNLLTGIDPLALFLICMGIALTLDYAVSGVYKQTARLQFGIFMVILGLLKISDLNECINYIIPLALIWLGAIFFVKALERK